MARGFTDSEIEYCREWAPKVGYRACARHLHRNCEALRLELVERGINYYKKTKDGGQRKLYNEGEPIKRPPYKVTTKPVVCRLNALERLVFTKEWTPNGKHRNLFSIR